MNSGYESGDKLDAFDEKNRSVPLSRYKLQILGAFWNLQFEVCVAIIAFD
jgi:hypothetical protein